MTAEEEYRQRVATLKTLDIDLFVSAMNDLDKSRFYAIPAHLQRDAALGAMHKARYEMPEMAPCEREESRKWLEAHGMKRLRGQEFPPR